MTKTTHPTVEALRLRTFTSRYEGTTCTACKASIAMGAEIALIPERIRMVLHELGMTNKVHKYCHLACLPTLIDPNKYADPVSEATAILMNQTDPTWPKDDIGFNAGDAGYAKRWLHAGEPPIGLHEMATRLVKYVNTQLGGEELPRNKAIIEAASLRSVTYDSPEPAPVEHSAEPKASPPIKTVALPGGITVTIQPYQAKGAIHLDSIGKNNLSVQLDPPWINESHAVIKEHLKHEGARWDKNGRYWRISEAMFLTHLDGCFQGENITLTPKAAGILEGVLKRRRLSTAINDEGLDELKAKIKEAVPAGHNPYPFQVAGVAFMEASDGRALIGDEMGTGKTIQSSVFLAIRPDLRPAVLVVPAIVRGNWVRELGRWTRGEKVQQVKTGKDKIERDTTIFVITYDLLKKHLPEIQIRKPRLVLSDECHYLKNPKAQRTKAFLDLCKAPSVRSVIGLSGTPIVNRPKEFYTMLKLLRPTDFANWKRYTERYCNGHYETIYVAGGRGATKSVWVCDGASHTEELAGKIKDVMIRRLKKDVLKELPPKHRSSIPVEMPKTVKRNYDKLVADCYVGEPGDHLAAINCARQLVGAFKAKAATELIDQYMSEGKPLLVFAHHKAVLDQLQAACKEAGYSTGRIDGSVTGDKRDQQVDAFQAGATDILLLSAKAAGVGITLTRASDVLFVERMWTPGDEEQAEDRTHRPGQLNHVLAQYLYVPDTVDDMMHHLIETKREILHSVLDTGKLIPEDLDIRKALMAEWTEKYRRVADKARRKRAKEFKEKQERERRAIELRQMERDNEDRQVFEQLENMRHENP